MSFNWFKINNISYGWFDMCIAEHFIEVSDFLSYDMPQKFLGKVIRILNGSTEEWLHLMDEPGASMLHIYLKNNRIHFAEYSLSIDSTELNDGDEKADRDKCEECRFDVSVDIQNTVDGIVTEFSLYENGNGRVLYEKHWGAFPVKEFEKLKECAFQLQEKAGEYDGLLCTTFLQI